MIITRYSTEVDNVTGSLSSLPVDKTTNQTGVSDSTILNPDKLNQSPVKPDQSESSVKLDEASVKTDQSSVDQSQGQPLAKPDQSIVKLDQSTVKLDQSSDQSVKLDQSSEQSVKLDQSPVRQDQSLVKPNQSIRPDQSSVELNVKLDQSVKPEQSLIRPDQFLVKPDQTIDRLSHMTTTTLDAPPNHPTVVMATQPHEQDVVSSMTNISNTIVTHVNQSSPPIYGKKFSCNIT